MKKIALLGSTGSIGRQTLEVVDAHPSLFSVEVLSGKSNTALLLEQVFKYKPKAVFVPDATAAEVVRQGVAGLDIPVYADWSAFPEWLQDVDFVVGAIGGAAGIEPTLMALQAGRCVGLANKETLVSAGDIVESHLKAFGGSIIPVDSEHSAIFQCLEGRPGVDRLILTASGGPFRQWPLEKFQSITLKDALNHPNWSMGRKITVDSATMMNKGLEVIEAQRLFHLPLEAIDVVIHPESIVHSMVQFVDGSVIAQLGLADMRVPIQYAMSWPERVANAFPKLDLTKVGHLTFEAPRFEAFPAIRLAYAAARSGGSMPAVMNAANEVAVDAFLNERIRFTEIIAVVQAVMDGHSSMPVDSLEALLAIDAEARAETEQFLAGKASFRL